MEEEEERGEKRKIKKDTGRREEEKGEKRKIKEDRRRKRRN